MNEEAVAVRQPSVGARLVRRVLPIAILLLIAAGLYWYWQTADHSPQPSLGGDTPEATAVHVVTVQAETVPIRPRYLGQTYGSMIVEIRSRVAGHLAAWEFEEGEMVQKGQKLFQIDPRPYQVQLAQAKAELARSEATLLRATREVQRNQPLVESSVVTREEFERLQEAERVASADVQMQQARIAAIELQLEYASIESPINGKVGMALNDIGTYIDVGPNSLLTTVQQVDPMNVRFFITEHDILDFRRDVAEGRMLAPPRDDLEIELTLADGSIFPHKGRINFLDIEIDQRTGTSITRGVVPNPDGFLIPGQFIYATILGLQRVGMIQVPQSAVLQSPIGASVYVVNDQDVAESRPVVLGEWSSEDQWIIESGLEPGDRVIVDRLMQIRPGSPVTILEGTRRPGDDSAAPSPGGAQSPTSGDRATQRKAPAPSNERQATVGQTGGSQ